MENLLRFRVGNIIGLSLRKVPHLPMCANLILFMVLNISTFCREALVVIFPTSLVSPDLSSNEKVIAFQDLLLYKS